MADKAKTDAAAAEEEVTTDEEETDDTEEEADADEDESEGESADDDSEEAGKGKKKKPSEESIDWKKVAEEETDAREKAEKALAGDRYHSKDRKGKKKEADKDEDGDEDEGDDEEKYLTPKQLERVLARERQMVRREVMQSQIEEIAAGLSESDDEASAIVAIHSNRIFPESMPLKQQLREAYFIAHGPRLMAKRDELRRSLGSKATKKKSGNENAHRDEPKGNEPKAVAQDKAEMQRLGFKWDGKRYTKKMSNGKFLVKDPRSGKVFTSAA